MYREQAPASQIETCFTFLREHLHDVPELQHAFELSTSQPEKASTIYSGYIDLIISMTNLNTEDRQTIQSAKTSMLETDGNFGTASQVTADDILQEIGDNANTLETLATESTNQSNPYFTPAANELTVRLMGGHRMKLSGKQPSDEDPESKKVIWGHTMIGDPVALLHFISCHHLERFLAVGLSDKGSQLAQQKDFLLNALIDVVLLDQTKERRFTPIYDMWNMTKEQGGLGWITADRRASYGL